jgi:cell division protein FtsI/penicillin-binding protein 2
MAFRFFTLTLIFGVLYGLLGFNLYRLQIKKSEYYVEKVEARSETLSALDLRRGQIFFTDRNNKLIPVALNKDYPVVYAVPKEIENPSAAAEIISSITGLPKEKLVSDFSNSKSLFKLLVEKAPPEILAKIGDLKLKGIYKTKKQYRFYPFGKLASNLLGFVGINDQNDSPTGLYGIEKFYNGALAEGEDVQLTIDLTLEAQAEETLKELVEKFNAVGGTIIIQEPTTGKILALANWPDFDPNVYSDYPVKNFLNPAVGLQYEPGSVFKPITMAAGIDLGILTPETTFFDNGSVTLNGKTITNWDKKAYGRATMTNVIERSINTGAVFAEQKLGHANFYNYLKKFGFGEKTEIDLPDEIAGSLKNLEKKDARDIDFATASFGQGTAVTPLQLINAFSSIANGGLLMRPYVNAKLEPYVIRRVISGKTAELVTKMMESAVLKAQVASIPGYRVAGKTGTAQIPDLRRGGYTDEFIHTFVGFAPASKPRFVALLKIDKPNATLAGQTVVPAFQKLAQFILNYYNVPPDRVDEGLSNQN